MTKLTFDMALQRLNDGRSVYSDNVLASALRRKVWVAEWHLPGCLSESWSVYLTKTEAVEAALDMAAGEDGPPRGMKTDLMRHGYSDRTAPDAISTIAITTVEKRTLADIL